MLSEFSPFLNEGKYLLIEEFGRDYGTYFSILELISLGKTSRPEIESILGSNVGGHLERLERDYGVIKRYRPFGDKSTRSVKFSIKDNFLNFWFRFFYRNRQAIETKNFQYVKNQILQDYKTYSGKYLENFFIDLLAQTEKYNRIGPYWEHGNQNEIDIVAIDDLKKEMLIAEVKLNHRNLNEDQLKRKAYNLIRAYPDYKIHWGLFSLKNASQFISE